MLIRTFVLLCRYPPVKRLLWHRWYQVLARQRWQADWTFMNYGYAPAPGERRVELRPADEPNRPYIQLYDAVASAEELRGLEVLEVGSGRGGGASFLRRYHAPARVTGTDISARAVALCRRLHPVEGLEFRRGDAESLPFPAGSFDAVVNVESSHCYGSVDAFLAEVRRVLRPGGRFLYADFRDADALPAWRRQLDASGLELRRESDITGNVLAALDAEDDRKRGLIARRIPAVLQPVFRDFAALRGSQVYEAFRSRSLVYRAYSLRKA